jgi:ferric-dicitrate binding protein FerR (iron transport regulator)
MTFVHVDVHHDTHTCPAMPDEPHPYDTRRTIVAVVDGGPCRQPVTVRSGDTTAVIACGRHEPAYRRCPACRVTVIEHAVTFTHHGYQGPQHPTAGVAA